MDKRTYHPRVTRSEYIESGGTRCPYCRSFDVQTAARFIEREDGTVSRSAGCVECGGKWDEIYTLVRFERR